MANDVIVVLLGTLRSRRQQKLSEERPLQTTMKTKSQILLLSLLALVTVLLYTQYLRSTTEQNKTIDIVQIHVERQVEDDSSLQESLNFETSRELRQRERKTLIEKFCQKTGHNQMADLFHIAVIPSLKILYCVMPKAASRQLRAMLYRFNSGGGELRLRKFPPDQQKEMLETYFKFTFVREPFERIVSAYKDKFVYPRRFDRSMLEFHGREILKNFRPNASPSSLEQLNDITFREFIEYLVTKGSNKSTAVMDWHWDNYVNICGMCAIKYDFIGHYETFNQDLADFKEAARLTPEQASRFKAHFKNKSDTASSLLEYYSQIPLEWVNVLGGLLRANFEMFGYNFPGPLQSLFE